MENNHEYHGWDCVWLDCVTIESAGLAVFMIYQKSREEARDNSRTDEDSAGND